MKKLFLLALVPLLVLASCGPDRAARDARLLNSCNLAMKAMIAPEDSIEIKKSTYISEKSPDDTALRTVNVHVYHTRGHGTIEEKDYSCAFEEEKSLVGYSFKFYRLDMGDAKYGNFNGVIEGDLTDIVKISEAITGFAP